MQRETALARRLLWGALLVAALVTTARFVVPTPPKQQEGSTAGNGGLLAAPLKERRIAQVPAFLLTERSGRQVSLAELRGKIWIAATIWTRCVDECPLMSAQMARLQAEFADEPHLQIVTISVDPEYDTPAVLTEYADRFGADPERWLFLTGDKSKIYRLVREGFKLGVGDLADPHALRQPIPQGTESLFALREAVRDRFGPSAAWAHAGHDHRGEPVLHSDRFVLVDEAGWIRGYYSNSDPTAVEQLRHEARALLRALKAR